MFARGDLRVIEERSMVNRDGAIDQTHRVSDRLAPLASDVRTWLVASAFCVTCQSDDLGANTSRSSSETSLGVMESVGSPASTSTTAAESSGETAERESDSGPEPEPEPEPPVLADPIPPAISGGTLLLSRNGELLFASDPARDLVAIVDISRADSPTLLHTVDLGTGAEPGRIVVDDGGFVHVALRRRGTVVRLDPTTGTILDEREACGNPRGLGFDPSDGSIWVACAEGVLAHLAADGTRGVTRIDRDLRDVVDVGPPLRVSTLRDAAVLTIGPDGAILEEHRPEHLAMAGDEFVGPATAPTRPSDSLAFVNTARHAWAAPGGGWWMLHQAARTVRSEPTEATSYGGACLSRQPPVLSTWDSDTGAVWSLPFEALSVAYDGAVADDGLRVSVVGVDRTGPAVVSLALADVPSAIGICLPWVEIAAPPPGIPTAVVFDPRGHAWVQIHEPAMLLAYDGADAIAELSLSDRSVADTGHQLFHDRTPAMLACASCHPEGGDDGMIWQLETIGPRRTQSLLGGIHGTEPFHWSGDLPSMAELIELVLANRLNRGGLPLDHHDALERYVFALPALRPPVVDKAAADLGREAFVAAGCALCHEGDAFTNNETIGLPESTPMQVPSLRGVGLRPPYMHDGRAATLDEAVAVMLELFPPADGPVPIDVPRLVDYLRSL